MTITKIQKILRDTFGRDFPNASLTVNRQASKRNKVFLVASSSLSEDVVVKIFDLETAKSAFENEMFVYRHPRFVKNHGHLDEEARYRIPMMISAGTDYIVQEKAYGENLMDVLTKRIQTTPVHDEFWSTIIRDLVYWEVNFFQSTNLLTADNHIRNYIVGPDVLYRVDFEDLIKDSDDFALLVGVIAEVYFSFLAAWPGIVEGKCMKPKSMVGKLFLSCLKELYTEERLDLKKLPTIDDIEYIFRKKLVFSGRKQLLKRLQFNRMNNSQYKSTMQRLNRDILPELKS